MRQIFISRSKRILINFQYAKYEMFIILHDNKNQLGLCFF